MLLSHRRKVTEIDPLIFYNFHHIQNFPVVFKGSFHSGFALCLWPRSFKCLFHTALHLPSQTIGLLDKPVSFDLSVSPRLSCKWRVDLGLDLIPVWLSCRSSLRVEPVLLPSMSGGGSVLVVPRLAGSGRCLWPLVTLESWMWSAAACDYWIDQLHHSELTNGDFLILTLLLSNGWDFYKEFSLINFELHMRR